MIDYDKPGHCIITGEQLYEDRVLNGKLERVWTGEKDEMTMFLNDGSKMRVMVSRKAKLSFVNNQENFDKIMDKVIKGWGVEVSNLVKNEKKKHWDKDRADKHMQEYSKKKVIDRIDDLSTKTKEAIDRKVNNLTIKLIREAKNKEKK